MRCAILILPLLVFLPLTLRADEGDPVSMAKEARGLLDRARYTESLEIYRELIDRHGKHALVTDGDAHWYASRCLRYLGEPVEAAELLQSYLKKFPKGGGVFSSLVGIFHSFAEAGDDRRAQKAGREIFSKYPDAKGTFNVLWAWIERGWKTPRLSTSYQVLYGWTFDRIDAARDPDLRLAFLDLIEANHRSTKFVRGGAILFCRAWCHNHAGRVEEALALCEKHLKFFPKDVNRDKVRVLMARVLLGFSPPQTEKARKLLLGVAANEESRYRKEAQDLLGMEPKDTSIQIEKGFPRPEGLGKIALLTNLSTGSSYYGATTKWREARDPEVVSFRGSDPGTAASQLRKIGPEFVAVLVAPATLDNNFHLSVLELCRGLDADPMPDFSFGYLCARDADDLEAMLSRILAKEAEPGTEASVVPVPTSGGQIGALDFFLHFGHGTARRIVKGLTAEGVAQLSLPRGPVIFSGACFNGVCSRSFESSLLDYGFHRAEELTAAEVISLAWVHAGATAFFAAMDGDRGEMAMAEWEYFKEHAPPLGEVIGRQYRLVFTSLGDDYAGFPRYVAGQAKRRSFYDVMLRGMTSRILLSDPMYRPLASPLESPTTRVEAKVEGTDMVVEIEVLRFSSGPFINTLPRLAGTPFKETRLNVRVALPEGFMGRLGRPTVEMAGKSAGVTLSRKLVRHEVWGGRRYVNIQLESPSGKLATAGFVARLVFPVR